MIFQTSGVSGGRVDSQQPALVTTRKVSNDGQRQIWGVGRKARGGSGGSSCLSCSGVLNNEGSSATADGNRACDWGMRRRLGPVLQEDILGECRHSVDLLLVVLLFAVACSAAGPAHESVRALAPLEELLRRRAGSGRASTLRFCRGWENLGLDWP